MEPATFRFVAQHLNHCATAVPRPLVGLSITVQSCYFAYCPGEGAESVVTSEWVL